MNGKTDVRANSREQAGDNRTGDAQDHPATEEQKLDEALKDSMDASDPPAATRPGDHGDPVPSSGFDEKEKKREGR